MFPPVAKFHQSPYKPHTTHNFLILFEEGLTLSTPIFPIFALIECIYFAYCFFRKKAKNALQDVEDIIVGKKNIILES